MSAASAARGEGVDAAASPGVLTRGTAPAVERRAVRCATLADREAERRALP
jgi:hypothetical protein